MKIKSTITWKSLKGDHIYTPEKVKALIEEAYLYIKEIPEEKICIIWEPSVEAIAVFMACFYANKIPCYYTVPNSKLDEDYFNEQKSALESQDIVLLGSPKFSYLDVQYCFEYQYDEYSGFTFETQSPKYDFMQFSSGTTGIRKRISYDGELLIRHLLSCIESYDIKKDDVIMSWLPHYHDLGLIASILTPLYNGNDIILMSNLLWMVNPSRFFSGLDQFKTYICWQPNFSYSFLHDRIPRRDFSNIVFFSGGEPVMEKDCSNFEKKFNTKVYGTYGFAETIMSVTVSNDNKSSREYRNSGLVIDNTNIEIREGVLWVKSPYLLKYYDTGESFEKEDGWFNTGDLASIDNQGRLYVYGREKDFIKVRGKKIIPEYIEYVVYNLEGVKKGRASCIQHKEQIILLYEGENKINGKILKNLGIDKVVNVPDNWLVKSSSGKISRNKCKEKYEESEI